MDPSGEDTSMQASENDLHGIHIGDINGSGVGTEIPREGEAGGVTDPNVEFQDSRESSGTRAGHASDHPLREPPSSSTNVESPGTGRIGAHQTETVESQNRIGDTERRGDERGSSLTEPRRPAVSNTGAQEQHKQEQEQHQQQQQQQRSTPASSTRSMVPDNEDDEENGNGTTASPRQYNLQNYASRDSGATMLESSPASKGMANLLVDDKDKYAISPCEDRQWAVLGLSEDILVRTIKISSYEKYSSLVKDFQVLASPTYPVNEWLDMGTFTAKSIHGEQTFELAEPAFARYLKFKLLSHYGDEFYCTLSQVKVHGSTMLESFQQDWQQNSAEVKEVQDIMKKDSKVAIGASSSNNLNSSRIYSESAQANGDAAGIHSTSPRPRVVPHQPGTEMPSNDGDVEHRPHAASVATVPVDGKRPGVNSGGAGVTVEEIVRGVPAEMVIPASSATCVGPTGADGACLKYVLAEDRMASATEGLGGGSDPVGAGVPSMKARDGGDKISDAQDRATAADYLKIEKGKTSNTLGTQGTSAEPAVGQQEARELYPSIGAIVDEGKKQRVGGVGENDFKETDVRGGTVKRRGEGEVQAGVEEPPPPVEDSSIPEDINRRKQSTGIVGLSPDVENGTSNSSEAVETGRVGHDTGGSVKSDADNIGKGASGGIAAGDSTRSSSEIEAVGSYEEGTAGGCVGGTGDSAAARSCGSIGKGQEITSSGIKVDVGVEMPSQTEAGTVHSSNEAPVGDSSKWTDSVASTAGDKAGEAGSITSSSTKASSFDVGVAATDVKMESQTVSSSQPVTIPPSESPTFESSGVKTELVGDPPIRVEGMDAAAAAAGCLERLSFSDFREEVLARTQQAHHSAAGSGVAIGGQYESIFKTLMNKIKTLEINQSLFGLYIDDVHACYQDVIAQIIKEQERTRASQSEMLHAQAAHIARLSDQWPAFQTLQGKVVEVENRMILGSMAWFTSLLCLAILLCTCCVNIMCRRPAVVKSERKEGNEERRYHHRDWSPASVECLGVSEDPVALTLFANEPDSPAKLIGSDKTDSVRESTSTISASSIGGRSGNASRPVYGSTERVRSAGVTRSTSPGTGRYSSCGEMAVGVVGEMSDARLEKRRW